jgi:hypothetical protein
MAVPGDELEARACVTRRCEYPARKSQIGAARGGEGLLAQRGECPAKVSVSLGGLHGNLGWGISSCKSFIEWRLPRDPHSSGKELPVH